MKKNLVKKLIKVIFDQNYRFLVLSYLGFFKKMNDEDFIKKKYYAKMGQELDLKEPKTFNEKLQWLKLYDRNPLYTILVDKYAVREYIANLIGQEYLIPLIGVWDNLEDIDFTALPQQFVIKCNHNSGLGMYICKDKSQMNIKCIKDGLKRGLSQNYYLLHREWPYKEVARKIIVEKYVEDNVQGGLNDYKIHSFNGEPKFILVCSQRFSKLGVREDFYDIEWKKLNISRPKCQCSEIPIVRPENLDEMIELTKKITANIPFARCDFYSVYGKVYFSEVTFFPAAGFEKFFPNSTDKMIGDLLILPN